MKLNDAQMFVNPIYRLIEITPIPVIVSSPSGKLEYANPALKQLLGYEGDEVYADDVVITHADDRELNKIIRAKLNQFPEQPLQIEKRYMHKLGHAIYCQLNIVAEMDHDGNVVRYISQIIDLTTVNKEAAADILLTHLVDKSNDAIFVANPQFGQILNCNQFAYRCLGYEKEELLKLTIPDINPDYDTKAKWQERVARIKAQETTIFESCLKQKDGQVFPTEVSVCHIDHQGKSYLLAIVRDISARKNKEQALIELANLDPLTQLPNRRYLEQLLNDVFSENGDVAEGMGFIYIDLDDFKQINDQHGHALGDEVLVWVAKQLKAAVRSTDYVIRMGGDEFLVTISGVTNTTILNRLAHKIADQFSAPFSCKGKSIEVTASIGVTAHFIGDGVYAANQLIEEADAAMYQAKKQPGTTIIHFS